MVLNRHRLHSLVNNRWFALTELGFVLLSAALWFARPELMAWPILVALLPWSVRFLAGAQLSEHTPVHIPISVFLLTGLVGVWAAYDREAALHKFWIILSAALVFFALANQPSENRTIVFSFFSFLGFSVGVYFLASNNWQTDPANYEIIQQVAEWWMNLRPLQFPRGIHPNDAASLVAMTIPLALAIGVEARRRKRKLIAILIGIDLAVAVFTVWLSSSRGTWVALGIVSLGWLAWRASVWKSGGTWPNLRSTVILVLFLVPFLVLSFVLLKPFGPIQINAWLESLESRLRLMGDTILLIEDFPFTGGGLRSFPGLYSEYILDVPNFNLIYSHNIFLDAALEQGILGSLALLVIYLNTAIALARAALVEGSGSGSIPALAGVVFAGMAVSLIHGLVDDVLYGSLGTPLLFLFPGLAVGLLNTKGFRKIQRKSKLPGVMGSLRSKAHRWKATGVGVVGLLALGMTIMYWGSLVGAWYANLGAVELAQIELVEWPTNEWMLPDDEEGLASVNLTFRTALGYSPESRTALHRLGLMAMKHQDYEAAERYLAKAYAIADTHRGIKKNLAYSYVWLGEYELARKLMVDIPEAKEELSVYIWWWGTKGRPDLASNADQMLDVLNSAEREPEVNS